IEKHFTLANDLPGPDHVYALEPPQLKELVARIREVEAALGSGEKDVQPEERELRAFARRTIFVSRPVDSGARLTRSDVSILRAGNLPYGLHPREYLRVLGRPVRRPLADGETLRAEDLDPLLLEYENVSLRPMEAGD